MLLVRGVQVVRMFSQYSFNVYNRASRLPVRPAGGWVCIPIVGVIVGA